MYIDVDALVSDVVNFWDNTIETQYQNPARREARIRHHLQRTVEDVWWHRAWPLAMTSTTLVMTAGSAARPTDFGRVGPEGALNDSNGRPWIEQAYQDLFIMRARGLNREKRYYCVADKIYVVDPTSTQSFTLIYQKQAPTITAGVETGLPQAFGHALLLGTVAKLKEEEGDPRPNWRADYLRALAQVTAVEAQKRSRVQQVPTSVPGMW